MTNPATGGKEMCPALDNPAAQPPAAKGATVPQGSGAGAAGEATSPSGQESGSPCGGDDDDGGQAGDSDPSQAQQQQGNGSYTNKHASGKTYSGKGGQQRMNQSAKNVASANNDPVVGQDHTTAADRNQSFIDEQKRIESNGGPGNNTYNKINSPGKKLGGGK